MTFDDVLTIKNGKNQRAGENANGRYPIYGSGGIMGYADDYICNPDTVIIGRKGNINKPIFVEEPFWNVDTAFGLEADKSVLLPKYLFYFCLKYDFERHNKAVTIPSLTKADLLKIEIELPSLKTQEDIVNQLDAINRTITLREEQLSKCDDLIKARFVEMFGDPVNNPLENKVFSLDEVCTKITDGTHDTPERYSDGYLLITGKNIRSTGIILDDVEYVSEADHKIIYARCNPEYEDVLYTNIGVNYGTACLNDLKYEFSMKNVALLKPNKEFINGYYLWICLNLMREYILDMNKVGGAQTFLGLATIKRIKIPIPPLSLQQEFINVINQINQSKKSISQSIEELQLLFESLMQEYFG